MRSPKFFQTSVQQPAVEQNVPAVESYPPVNVVEAFGSPRKPIAPSSVASAMKSPFHSSARKLVHNKQEEVTLYPQQLENPDNVNLALFQASILQPSLDITQVAEEDIDQISPNFCVKIDKSVASHQKQGTLSVTLYSTKLPPALNKKQTLKSRRWLELVVSEEFSLECAWSCMFSFRTSGSTHYYFDMKTLIVKDSFLLPFFLTMHSMSSSSASNSHYAGGIKAILYEDHVMQAVVSSALFFPSPVTQQGQIMDEIWLLDALAEDAPSSSRALRSSGQSLYRALQQASIVKDNIPKHCKVNYIKLLPSSGYQLPLPDAQVGSSGYQLVVGMDDLLPTAYGQIQYPNFDALCQKNPYISQCIQRCAAYASNGFVLTIMIGQQGMSKSLLSFLKTVPPAVMLSFLPIDASSMTFIQASTNSINENIKWTELFNHFKTLNQRLEKDDTSIPSGFMLFPDRNVMSSLKDTRESLLQMTSALSRKKAGSWHVHFYPKWTTASSTSWSEVEAMLTRPKGSHSMLLNWEEVLAMVPMMKLNLVSALIHFHLLQQSGQSANSQQNLSQHIGSLALLYEFFDIMEDSYARYQQNALHAISANSTWMDIAHDIILEMLQKHELFTKTGSIAVVLQDYLKSSLVAMCERVLLHPKLYSEDDFDDRVVEVRTLLDDHGGFQQWMEACDVYLLQCHAKHRQEENMVWTKFVDGFTYQQCYRRWLDSFGMPLSNTNRVATISLQDIAQASTYQEANNKMMMNPGLMMSTTHSSVGATFATTASNVMASDDIMSTLLEKVGMSDVGQASITRDALVQIGCQSWGDFMELLSIFSATNGNQLAMTSAQFMESLRKFLQEEVKLTLLNAMKIVNYFILLRNSS